MERQALLSIGPMLENHWPAVHTGLSRAIPAARSFEQFTVVLTSLLLSNTFLPAHTGIFSIADKDLVFEALSLYTD